MIKHLYVRGNYREDLLFDQIDMINAWNRIWLSALATDTKIMAVEILSNHFHICAYFDDNDEGSNPSSFMHYLRMSLSQYFNHRHKVQGSFGSRRYGIGHVSDPIDDHGEDLRDLICYIHRNVRHHNVFHDYANWQFSTFSCFFGNFENPQNCFTNSNLPKSLLWAYFPKMRKIPDGVSITPKGMIVPPEKVLMRQYVQDLFGTKEKYFMVSETTTMRESGGERHENHLTSTKNKECNVTDNMISDFIKNNMNILPVEMSREVRYKAILLAKNSFPKVSSTQLSRVFGIPYGTIKRLLRKAK